MNRTATHLLVGSLSLSVAISLSGCGSEQVGSSGGVVVKAAAGSTSQAALDATNQALAQLGPIGQISTADLSPSASSAAGMVEIKLTSSAKGYVDQERARWVAGMIVGEAWKRAHDKGDDSIASGSLASMPSDATADGAGTSLSLTGDLSKILFTDQDGSASPLVIKDEAAFRAQVADAAKAAGLSVSKITIAQSLGSVVMIDEVATDPKAYLATYGRNNPGLTLDPSQVEGVMLVIRDAGGNVVATSVWSTASQSGEGGPGPNYGDFAATASP